MLNCRFFGGFSSVAIIVLRDPRFRLLLATGFCVLPLNSRLIASKSTRSSLPSAIALPRAIHLSNCSEVMFFMAGDASLLVHGPSIPMALSRMMRAKQWSRCTGHTSCAGDLETASDGRVLLYSNFQSSWRVAIMQVSVLFLFPWNEGNERVESQTKS